MWAAASGKSTLGIPAAVGREFSDADKGGKLPSKAKDMAPGKWSKLKELISQWLTEEANEPEHAAEDIDPPKGRASSIAFVTSDGKVLFVKRGDAEENYPSHWAWPGGKADGDETAEDCAMREAREEIGDRAFDGMRQIDQKRTPFGWDHTTYAVPVKDEFEPKLNHEHSAYSWAYADEAPEPLHPGVRKTLDDVTARMGEDAALATTPNSGAPPIKTTEDDTIDTATVDIPLLIRLMEYAREDAPDDEALHSATERLTALAQAENRPLVMEDYEKIVGGKPAAVDAEIKREPDGKFASTSHHISMASKHRGIAESGSVRGTAQEAPHREAETLHNTARAAHEGYRLNRGQLSHAANERSRTLGVAQDAADPTGKLSTTTREDVDSTKHREDMPAGAFLGPNRTYPVKEHRDGEWKFTRNLLLAAARRARMQGRGDIAKRADAIRAREFPGAEDEVKHDPKTGQFSGSDPGHFPTFIEKHFGPKYVIAPPTARNRTRYPEHRFVTPKEWSTVKEKHKTEFPDAHKAYFGKDAAADPTGKLSTTTREDIDSTKHREDMPADAFLAAGRKYPVKEQRDGEWKYTRNLLLAAARRARMQGRGDIAKRADAIRAREFPDEAKDASIGPQGRATVGHQTDPNGGFGWAIGGRVGTGKGQMRMTRAVKSGKGLANVVASDMALDWALAEDRRNFDKDGRMHVDSANLTKCGVFEYLGSEINAVMAGDPNWKKLDPNKRYKLLRPAEEIEKAASTFNGLPILFQHKPASAEDHPTNITVGATGNDSRFEYPYLKNSLVIWPAYASEAVEDGTQKQLSAAYAYRAVVDPGVFEGENFDIKMVDLIGNHMAQVRDGRSGPTCAIDSKVNIQWAVLERDLLLFA